MGCLIVSHANTLRTLIKHIDNITDENIKGISIPTGIPLIYRLDKNLCPVDPNVEMEFKYMVDPKGYSWKTSRAYGFHGVYLRDVDRLRELNFKLDKRNRHWQGIIINNIVCSIGEENSVNDKAFVVATHDLYNKLQEKIDSNEYKNVLLIEHFKDYIENLLVKRRQWF